VGPGRQRERERKASVPLLKNPGWAVGRFSGWAEKDASAFFYIIFLFYLFFFGFLVYFITFAKRHQIHSNQFLIFSKNQHNVLK
jgi:hypothetical protein